MDQHKQLIRYIYLADRSKVMQLLEDHVKVNFEDNLPYRFTHMLIRMTRKDKPYHKEDLEEILDSLLAYGAVRPTQFLVFPSEYEHYIHGLPSDNYSIYDNQDAESSDSDSDVEEDVFNDDDYSESDTDYEESSDYDE